LAKLELLASLGDLGGDGDQVEHYA
jgi:hypothetical protein